MKRGKCNQKLYKITEII